MDKGAHLHKCDFPLDTPLKSTGWVAEVGHFLETVFPAADGVRC